MTNKEARERMAEIRERIAKLLCDKVNPLMSDTEAHSFWEEKASDSYKIGYRFTADQILNTQVTEDEICPECKGSGQIMGLTNIEPNIYVSKPCPICKGTGVSKSKTIRDKILE